MRLGEKFQKKTFCSLWFSLMFFLSSSVDKFSFFPTPSKSLHPQFWHHHRTWPMIFLLAFLMPISLWMLFFKYRCNFAYQTYCCLSHLLSINTMTIRLLWGIQRRVSIILLLTLHHYHQQHLHSRVLSPVFIFKSFSVADFNRLCCSSLELQMEEIVTDSKENLPSITHSHILPLSK